MSITARSFTGKRQFEEDFTDDGRVPLAEVNPYKRLRASGSLIVSPSGRCSVEEQHLSYLAFDQSSFTTLRSLFPDMTDDQILTVLAEHGDNIDTAIKHLTKLRLDTRNNNTTDETSQQQQQDNVGEKVNTTLPLFPTATEDDNNGKQHQRDATPPPTQKSTKGTSSVNAMPSTIIREATKSLLDEEQAQQQQQGPGIRPPGNTSNNNSNATKTAEQWVDHLVSEMTQATSVPDAKARAASILQSFEQTVLEHHGTSTQPPQQVTETLRENAILKRAVAIQNAKIQDLTTMLTGISNGGGGSSMEEVAQLRGAVQELQQRLHAAEVQNYSLQLHLKQATDGDTDPMQSVFRNPDVF